MKGVLLRIAFNNLNLQQWILKFLYDVKSKYRESIKGVGISNLSMERYSSKLWHIVNH